MFKSFAPVVLLLVTAALSFAQDHALKNSDETLVAVCTSSKCDVQPTQVSASLGDQISAFFSSITDTSQWPERWHCGTWSDFHGWLYILSDVMIWLSYFAIPIILAVFVYKKRLEYGDFKTIIVLFMSFILACGLTHLMDAAIFWWPAYKLSALLRFFTAVISLFTVFALIKILPSLLELKSPAFLEAQVKERTKALLAVNEQLNHEIAERKRTSDNLRDSNQELLAFSYSVSHDLRSPLRSIHGFSGALMEDYADNLDDQGKDFLKRICHASSRMGELIDDMLNLSKISRNEVMPEKLNLSDLFQTVASEMIGRNSDINATFDIESDITANGDPKLMKIALENLIDNAIKYSSKQDLAVVQFGKVPEENTYFIRDNGVGFDMQFSDKLFGAFQRLHEGEFEGSGIGLATVKRIIMKHGGKIWADAKVDQGATFYFTL